MQVQPSSCGVHNWLVSGQAYHQTVTYFRATGEQKNDMEQWPLQVATSCGVTLPRTEVAEQAGAAIAAEDLRLF